MKSVISMSGLVLISLASCSPIGSPTEGHIIREPIVRERLEVEASISAKQLQSGDSLVVTVKAFNPHRKTIKATYYSAATGDGVMNGTAIHFTKFKRKASGVVRDTVNMNPLLFDYVKAGEHREYKFKWTHHEFHGIGKGYIHVYLPNEFEVVKPMKLELND